MFGGNEYLDGFSVFDMGNGCRHIVTYGMTELYADEEAFGGKSSRWEYEMTLKLKADSAEECMWALDMLSNLARYTYTSERWFEPFECIHGGTPPAQRNRFQNHLIDHRCRYHGKIAGHPKRQG